MRIEILGRTDAGLRRKNNEDSFLVLPCQRYASVADGMGGAAAGEVASRIFVETVREYLQELNPHSEDDVKSVIRELFLRGNESIIHAAQVTPEYEGMGCTAEVIGFFEDRYVVGHVGDSRTYLFRDGELRQVTKDHSLVQHQIDEGLISTEEAKTHAMKNVVLRAVGIDPDVSLDIVRGRLLPGDIYLLCSDGLTDMISDSLISEILSPPVSLNDKVDLLISKALAAGGRDNVTVVLCQVVT